MASLDSALVPGLDDFSDWVGRRKVVTLGTNAGADALPFQNWRRFKEAFAPELIEQAVRDTPRDVRHIADPFGGSGTTALSAQFLGIRATTIEVNPFLGDLIEAKLSDYDLKRTTAEFSRVVSKAWRKNVSLRNAFPGAPSTFLEPGLGERFIFSRAVASRFCAYRSAIEAVDDKKSRRLFRVLLAAAAVPVSNICVSGKGRRYRSNWQDRPINPDMIDETFEQAALTALFDIRRYQHRSCMKYRLLRTDARRALSKVSDIDLAVFSPPYPNSFDYTDVYNVELWALGYLANKEQNRRLREATLRSHVQIKRDFSASPSNSSLLAKTYAKLNRERPRLWDRSIPEMVLAYFCDMRKILSALAQNLNKQGRVYIVVGDSRYGGINVPVSQILTEEAPGIGFRVIDLTPFRSMRASPQQGGQHKLQESLVVLEH
jgi:hypothetical protein